MLREEAAALREMRAGAIAASEDPALSPEERKFVEGALDGLGDLLWNAGLALPLLERVAKFGLSPDWASGYHEGAKAGRALLNRMRRARGGARAGFNALGSLPLR